MVRTQASIKLFFFFQAEDGIRDLYVTGVQTCALPISRSAARVAHVVTGPAGEFLAWSDTLSAMIGRETSAMPRTTRSWLELAHPEDRRRLRRVAIETARTGKGAELEYRLQRGPRDWLG